MIFLRKKIGLYSIRVILDDAAFLEARKQAKYSAITAVSYNKINLPEYRVVEKPTCLIDLSVPEIDIFQNFNDTTRNEVRRTERLPDLVFLSALVPTESSYETYSKFEYAQGRAPGSWDEIKHTLFFGAFKNDDLISGVFVIPSSTFLRVRSIFSERLLAPDKETRQIISYSSRRVMWEICKWGKINGFKSLDLASVNSSTPKSASIAKFKLSFGGKVIPEYTYIYQSFLYRSISCIVSFLVKVRVSTHRFLSIK